MPLFCSTTSKTLTASQLNVQGRPLAFNNSHKHMYFTPDGSNVWDFDCNGTSLFVGANNATANSAQTNGNVRLVSRETNGTCFNHTITGRNCTVVSDTNGNITISVNLPVGSIIMWNSTTIPAGWAECNGTNGTPDLRNRFIKARSESNPSLGSTGGSHSITLNVTHLPSHNHTINHTHGTYTTASALGSHNHTVTINNFTGNSYENTTYTTSSTLGNHSHSYSHNHSASSTSAGAHTHSYSHNHTTQSSLTTHSHSYNHSHTASSNATGAHTHTANHSHTASSNTTGAHTHTVQHTHSYSHNHAMNAAGFHNHIINNSTFNNTTQPLYNGVNTFCDIDLSTYTINNSADYVSADTNTNKHSYVGSRISTDYNDGEHGHEFDNFTFIPNGDECGARTVIIGDKKNISQYRYSIDNFHKRVQTDDNHRNYMMAIRWNTRYVYSSESKVIEDFNSGIHQHTFYTYIFGSGVHQHTILTHSGTTNSISPTTSSNGNHAHNITVNNQNVTTSSNDNHAHTITVNEHKGTTNTANLAHTHVVNSHNGTTNSTGAHTHPISVANHDGTTSNTDLAHTHILKHNHNITHTHSNSVSSVNLSHTHNLTIPIYSGSSGNVGGGQAFDNQPQWYCLIFIMKIAEI